MLTIDSIFTPKARLLIYDLKITTKKKDLSHIEILFLLPLKEKQGRKKKRGGILAQVFKDFCYLTVQPGAPTGRVLISPIR